MCKEDLKKEKASKIKFVVLPFSANAIIEKAEGNSGCLTQSFEKLEGVIHLNGDTTVAVLEDGSKGIAVKGNNDNYSVEIGAEVAFCRALIGHIEKHIKEISGPKVV